MKEIHFRTWKRDFFIKCCHLKLEFHGISRKWGCERVEDKSFLWLDLQYSLVRVRVRSESGINDNVIAKGDEIENNGWKHGQSMGTNYGSTQQWNF